jgi:hypothetical protein
MADEQVPLPVDGQRVGTRKPFEPPQLTVYGDIATLTQSMAVGGKADGAHGSKSRTT